jgi:hypothetical protein
MLEPAEAHRFAMETIHEETVRILLIVNEICLRFPPNNDLIFLRYLLRMVEAESKAASQRKR